MQQSLINFMIAIWHQAWPWVLRGFDLISIAWKFLWSYVKKISIFFQEIYALALNFFQWCAQEISQWKPIAVNYATDNPKLAYTESLIIILLIVFWIQMLRHAHSQEPTWKKTWAFIIFFLGPAGAAIYYFFRKRVLEKKDAAHNKVMASFFTPMSHTTPSQKK